MTEIIKAPKGTKDILPAESQRWDRFINEICGVFKSYGYGRIETPIFEVESLFVRAIGDGTDIVNKEMYSFADKGGRAMALRPEETAGVVRSYIENSLYRDNPVLRVYYHGPMFRYERPQGGRQRQFWQTGVEVLGSAEPAMDAEVIDMAVRALTAAGLSNLTLRINSVGCSSCRPAYAKALSVFVVEKKSEFCETCAERASANPLRVFDCKNPGCRSALASAPSIRDSLCEACAGHFAAVQTFLGAAKTDYVDDATLVRGLDYYTSTVFEVTSSRLGAQDAVAAGGRYDDLVKKYGGPDTAAFGFAIGIERALLASEDNQASTPSPYMYIAPLGGKAVASALILAVQARSEGISAVIDYSGKPLKKQLAAAHKSRAKLAVIIGDEELAKDEVIVRDMENSGQTSVTVNDFSEWIRAHNNRRGT